MNWVLVELLGPEAMIGLCLRFSKYERLSWFSIDLMNLCLEQISHSYVLGKLFKIFIKENMGLEFWIIN